MPVGFLIQEEIRPMGKWLIQTGTREILVLIHILISTKLWVFKTLECPRFSVTGPFIWPPTTEVIILKFVRVKWLVAIRKWVWCVKESGEGGYDKVEREFMPCPMGSCY